MRSWLPKIGSWVIFLIAIGLIDVALVGGQTFWHRGDEAKLDELKASLDEEHAQIATIEGRLQTCEDFEKSCKPIVDQFLSEAEIAKAESAKLVTLKKRALKRALKLGTEYETCTSSTDYRTELYRTYGDNVGLYNGEVRKANKYSLELERRRSEARTCVDSQQQCQSVYSDYSHRVDSYNSRVAEANDLAKKVGTIWYIVPVPRFAGRAED